MLLQVSLNLEALFFGAVETGKEIRKRIKAALKMKLPNSEIKKITGALQLQPGGA